MSSRHLSVRLQPDTYERLDRTCRQTGQTRSGLTNQLIEEGLRMAAHPGIVFRDGPAGRRPGLSAGPDIWEVARVLRDVAARGEPLLEVTAELTDLRPDQVQVVSRYYADFREEIDEWIALVDAEADEAYARWLREQAIQHR